MKTKTQKKRILLIEDENQERQDHLAALTKAGYVVETASDGVRGITQARAGGFDLILLDLMMPNMDGLGFLRGLAEEPPRKPNGPVVVLADEKYKNIAAESKRLGAAGFIVKTSLSSPKLIKAVKKFLQRDRSSPSPTASSAKQPPAASTCRRPARQ
jgi:CheY-like chemotaxis protein